MDLEPYSDDNDEVERFADKFVQVANAVLEVERQRELLLSP